jgi:SAM-dependent methyltransferase
MDEPRQDSTATSTEIARLIATVDALAAHVQRLNQRLAKTEERLDKLTTAHLDPTEKIPYLNHLVRLGGLTPGHAVLDVGCGPGRIAVELSGYLDSTGRYTGIEVQRKAVDALVRDFAERPNFVFRHADVRNTEYNARGTIAPEDYVFPVPDGSIDLVVLRSVFTHMLPPEVEHYMREIARVLRPGGRSLITYYLLNDQSKPFVTAQPPPVYSAFPLDGRGSFPHDCGVYRIRYREVPERAVAYEETFVRALYARVDLQILEPLHYGSWSGRVRYLTGQDLVAAEKAHRRSGT